MTSLEHKRHTLAHLLAQAPPAPAASTAPSVDDLVSRAKAAAGLDWSGTFTRMCIPPPPAGVVIDGKRWE